MPRPRARSRAAVGAALGAASGQGDLAGAASGLFEACIAAIPYAPAAASWPTSSQARGAPGRARTRCGRRDGDDGSEDGEALRVALLADGIGSMHGVTRTIVEIRERGVPGFEIEVVGTDPEVDRRLPAVAEIDVPFYPGLRIGVPSLPAAVQNLRDGRLRPRPRLLARARPGSPARCSRARWGCRCSAATTPS